jgi:hypothetical protein
MGGYPVRSAEDTALGIGHQMRRALTPAPAEKAAATPPPPPARACAVAALVTGHWAIRKSPPPPPLRPGLKKDVTPL